MSSDPGTRTDQNVAMQWSVKVPLRDGIHLAATLYLPGDQREPAPTLFILTPYIAQTFHERGIYFATHGYPFLTIDVRGRGNSEGEFRCFRDAAEDSYDVIEWLARQPYCNGKVAMWGGSYQGWVQWVAAGILPPHLATIVPVAAPHQGFDSPMRNNILGPYSLQWLNMIAGRTSQEKVFMDQSFWNRGFQRWFESGACFADLDRRLGFASQTFQEWLEHPFLDDYWDRLNPTADQYARIAIPVLTITGIYDGDQPGALRHYREHLKHNPDACHYLIIGPWDHAGTRTPRMDIGGLKVGEASLVDLQKLHAQWYAWTMQDGSKPPFLQKKVAYYVMGAEQWRYADTLDGVTAHEEALYLHSYANPLDVLSSGLLVGTPPRESEPDWYVYDPRDVDPAEVQVAPESAALNDQRIAYAMTGKQLVYHSVPFEAETEISGFFRLAVWLSIDQPDTDFSVSIYEVSVDGSAIQLTSDLMRARHRKSLRSEALIRSAAPLRYDFNRFTFVSRRLQARSRLRLIIGPLNSIHAQKNYNTGGEVARETIADARVVTVKLFHDESHPSALYVPMAQPE
jgi:uncharacterized protein